VEKDSGRGEPLTFFAIRAAGENQVFWDNLVVQNFLGIVDVLDELKNLAASFEESSP
jgi:hypothetical protein